MQKNQTLSRVAPFLVYILFLILADLFSAQLGIQTKWFYVIKIIAVIAVFAYFAKNLTELNKLPPFRDFLYATVSGLIVFVVWIFPYPSWLVAGVDAVATNPIAGFNDLDATIWLSTRILGAALVVPIIEELFWRSYIMRRYDKDDFLNVDPATISSFAYVGSACLFAIEHKLWLAGLFAGLVYGELYKTYKNLWVPIFAHGVTNAILGVYVISTGHWQYW